MKYPAPLKRWLGLPSLVAVLLLSITVVQAAPKSPATFTIVSWNLQTFGKVSTDRQEVCRAAYDAVITTSVFVVSFQEVANVTGINTFQVLIPPRTPGWQISFEDTRDSQDNGFLSRVGRATMTSDGFLFEADGKPDTSLATHPFRVGHFKVGSFDFTLVSLHLTYQAGNADESKRELNNILDWLQAYLANRKNDPDVIIAGDFNLPSVAGKPKSVRANESKWPTIESIIAEHGGFEGKKALTVLIDEPTSRSSKHPANNYDHFIVTERVRKKALIRAERVPVGLVDSVDQGKGVQISDHYPIEAVFRTRGKGIRLNNK